MGDIGHLFFYVKLKKILEDYCPKTKEFQICHPQ